jgi:hypothetical protein
MNSRSRRPRPHAQLSWSSAQPAIRERPLYPQRKDVPKRHATFKKLESNAVCDPPAFQNGTAEPFPQRRNRPQTSPGLLASMQRLRGTVYVNDGAIRPSDLTADGRHALRVDEHSWHVLSLNRTGQVSSCLRYTDKRRAASFENLWIRQAALARCPEQGDRFRSAVEREMTRAPNAHGHWRSGRLGGCGEPPAYHGAGRNSASHLWSSGTPRRLRGRGDGDFPARIIHHPPQDRSLLSGSRRDGTDIVFRSLAWVRDGSAAVRLPRSQFQVCRLGDRTG